MERQILNYNNNIIDFNNDDNEDDLKIYITILQRNNRKFYTNIKGIDKKYDYKLILCNLKKKFSTNGFIYINKNTLDKSIQLNGDLRIEVTNFLINEKITEKKNIIYKIN